MARVEMITDPYDGRTAPFFAVHEGVRMNRRQWLRVTAPERRAALIARLREIAEEAPIDPVDGYTHGLELTDSADPAEQALGEQMLTARERIWEQSTEMAHRRADEASEG